MQFELVIKADTNDADYVTSTTKVTMDEIIEILPVIEAIKQFNLNHRRGSGEYNWPDSEYRSKTVEDTYPHIDPKLLEIFGEYTPYGENGIHTIESVVYYPLPEKVKLL